VQIANPDLIVQKKTLKKGMNRNTKASLDEILKNGVLHHNTWRSGIYIHNIYTLLQWCLPLWIMQARFQHISTGLSAGARKNAAAGVGARTQ